MFRGFDLNKTLNNKMEKKLYEAIDEVRESIQDHKMLQKFDDMMDKLAGDVLK